MSDPASYQSEDSDIHASLANQRHDSALHLSEPAVELFDIQSRAGRTQFT
jgi:hypothetical protein